MLRCSGSVAERVLVRAPYRRAGERRRSRETEDGVNEVSDGAERVETVEASVRGLRLPGNSIDETRDGERAEERSRESTEVQLTESVRRRRDSSEASEAPSKSTDGVRDDDIDCGGEDGGSEVVN